MDPSREQLTQQPASRPRLASKTFVIGMVAVVLSLGFTLGLIVATWLDDSRIGPSSLYDEDLVSSLFEKASPAVVEFSITRRSGEFQLPGSGTGSGFLVDKSGHIITNHHVVSDADEIRVRLFDGRILEAKRLGTSPADDLALVRVDAEEVASIRPLPLADSDNVSPGQMAIAIGSPFRHFNSITVGVVSGTGRGPASVLQRPIPDMIQTDTPLNPGNSGGPLLNSKGEVIGVTSSIRIGPLLGLDEYRIGFAVPSNTVKDLMPELLRSQRVRRPWLGISGGSVSRDLSGSQGLPQGIFISRVFPDSPAEEAGLVPFLTLRGTGQGDVITAVDERPVGSIDDMVSYFNKLRPGDKVTLSVVRNSRTIELEITLAEWPDT